MFPRPIEVLVAASKNTQDDVQVAPRRVDEGEGFADTRIGCCLLYGEGMIPKPK